MTREEMQEFLTKTPLITHFGQFESKWAQAKYGVKPNIKHDTGILLNLYDDRLPQQLGAASLALEVKRALTHGEEITTMTGKELREQNVSHAQATYQIAEKIYPQLSPEEKKVYKEVLIPLVNTLAQVELAGVCIDKKMINRVVAGLQEKTKRLHLDEDTVIKEFNANSDKPFNIRSHIHRRIVVFDMLGYEPFPGKSSYTKSGLPSTEGDILEALLKKRYTSTLEKIVKASQYYGWEHTHLIPFKDEDIVEINGRWFIFTSLWMGKTSTARLKSENPNLQNFPGGSGKPGKWVRRIFISRYPGGSIIEWDYDGIELRIAASIADDDIILTGFLSGDPHAEVAKELFGKTEINAEERAWGKRFNYALLNGAYINKLVLSTGADYKFVKKLYDKYEKKHHKLLNYCEDYIKGDAVYSPSGMKRHFKTQNEARAYIHQNIAFITIARAMNMIVPYVENTLTGAVIDLQVHDSLRADCPKGMEKKLIYPVKEIMESIKFPFMKVPFTVTPAIGHDWEHMEKVK